MRQLEKDAPPREPSSGIYPVRCLPRVHVWKHPFRSPIRHEEGSAGELLGRCPPDRVCDFNGSKCDHDADQESLSMKFARRLTQKRWVQKTIGVAAAEDLRLVWMTSRFTMEPADPYRLMGANSRSFLRCGMASISCCHSCAEDFRSRS